MTKKTNNDYAFYSKPLKQVFDSLDELRAAEAKHFNELKAKEDKATQKKADAAKVEDTFKALNAARKEYKEAFAQLTQEYSEQLTHLKEAYELGKKDIHDKLAAAEDAYSKALKEFTTKYDQYHVTLKDGDFETTISGSRNTCKENNKTNVKDSNQANLYNIFDLFFGM